MTLARLNAVRPNPERRPSSPARVVAASGIALEAPLTADGLLQVQHTAGNAAATEIVQRQPQIPGMEPYVPGGAPATGGGATEGGGERRTLRYGDTGDDVKVLQMKLGQIKEREWDREESGLARIDGIFGPLTREDVIEFQSDTGLDPDGVVGPRTWNALHSLVPAAQHEATERGLDAAFMAAVDLELAGRYDESIAAFDAIRIEQQQTPENANPVLYHMALCNQQRGRFGMAVSLYEQGLEGRFNQEERRAQLLENLAKARSNHFLDSPQPDPETPVAGAEGQERYEGGGITERVPVHAGDTGETANLFKGKLAHAMSAWLPPVSDGDQIDANAVTTIQQFQRACGLPQTGEGDAQTWHALDTFSPHDIPNTVMARFGERLDATANVENIDVATSIPLWEQLMSDAREAGLVENAKYYELRLGHAYHRLSQFEQALIHYEAYLKRVIPEPELLGYAFESIRMARERQPVPKG